MQSHIDIAILNELQFTNLFNSHLINSVSNIVFMYEWIDNDYKLIKWNKNHLIFTGYSKEESFHKSVLDFIPEDGHDNIKKAIENIFKTGKVQVFDKLLTKYGNEVPYYYEAYQFNFLDRQIFIGMGVDVSDHSKTKEKLELSEEERRKLLINDNNNKKELLAYTAQVLQNNVINNKIKRQVDKLLTLNDLNQCKDEINKLKKIIESQQNSQDNWELYKIKFNKVHIRFIDDLKTKHPNLTKSELRFCTYLKMEFPTLEIASILNISKESIIKKKYRIRKKLNLDKNEYLEHYFSKI